MTAGVAPLPRGPIRMQPPAGFVPPQGNPAPPDHSWHRRLTAALFPLPVLWKRPAHAATPRPRRGLRRLLALGITLPPLLAYAVGRVTSTIPAPIEWSRLGMNHGPWHYSLWGGAVFPAMGLAFGIGILSGAHGVAVALRSRRLPWADLMLLAASAAVVALYNAHLVWAID